MIDITVVLDKSGSMQSIKDSTIEGYNSFLQKQKELRTEGYLTLVQFNSDDYKKGERESINYTTKLTNENYKPDACTPLLDALGKTIKETGDKLRDMTDKPDKVLFVIITDGQENSSKEYKRTQIFDMIDHQRNKYNWEFVYLGANQDSFAEGGWIGVGKGSTMNFASSLCMYNNVSTMVNRYSMSGDSNFTDTERKLQATADKEYNKQ